MRNRLLKAVVGLTIVGALATVSIGLLHTQAFRSLLMAAGGCPVGGDSKATPAQREATRQRALNEERGKDVAAVTSFFGLELGVSTRAEIDERLKSRAACTSSGADMVLECLWSDLSSFGVSCAGTTFFRFDDQKRLIAWVVMPKPMASTTSSIETFEHFAATFSKALGAPHQRSGELTEAFLNRGALRQTRQEFHFSNLISKIVATNMGDGIQIIAEAQWLPMTASN